LLKFAKQLPRLVALVLPFSAAFSQSEQDSVVTDLINAAVNRTNHVVTYDGSYFGIGYPGGDIPKNKGVCTDVIIRSYREIGVDLQELVHLDMEKSFDVYPDYWGLNRPDTNIDHRRVPNLQTFFSRHGRKLPVSATAANYEPGDLVTWRLPGNLSHIGIVVNRKSADGVRHLVVHNIGQGPKREDVLFRYEITGHYRYFGPEMTTDVP
jgi:uncharacterized protein YijF (DUF1287 family)